MRNGLRGAAENKSPDTVRSALEAIRKHLGMEVAYISEFVDNRSVFRHCPVPIEPVEIKKRVSVPNLHRPGGQIIRRDADPLIHMFHFRIVRLGRAVRKNDAFMNEIVIVWIITEPAAKRQKLALGIAAIPNALVFPFPNRAAHERRIQV